MLAELALLASTCAPDVHLNTLRAVIKHESGFNQYAIGINKGERLKNQPKSLDDAIRTVEDLIERKVDFDAGLGQINVRNWAWLGLTPRTVFDPCMNLKASQAVLKDCYVRATKQFQEGQPALMAAFSCYNTGNFERGFRNGYVEKVLSAADVKVPSVTSHSLDYLPRKNEANPHELRNPAMQRPVDTGKQDNKGKDAFSQPKPDAFSQPRLDVFGRGAPRRSGVGSIVYHAR